MAVLDDDKEGFLRSARSLIQTVGRAARNLHGKAIFYADKITPAMRETMDETARRRTLQQRFNEEHHIKPRQVQKKIVDVMEVALKQSEVFKAPEEKRARPISRREWEERQQKLSPKELSAEIDKLNAQMIKLARELKFEEAALVRDKMQALQQMLLLLPGREAC